MKEYELFNFIYHLKSDFLFQDVKLDTKEVQEHCKLSKKHFGTTKGVIIKDIFKLFLKVL